MKYFLQNMDFAYAARHIGISLLICVVLAYPVAKLVTSLDAKVEARAAVTETAAGE